MACRWEGYAIDSPIVFWREITSPMSPPDGDRNNAFGPSAQGSLAGSRYEEVLVNCPVRIYRVYLDRTELVTPGTTLTLFCSPLGSDVRPHHISS
ncbi:hypothetical protein ACOMHN_009629 [Nucella lapillus]